MLSRSWDGIRDSSQAPSSNFEAPASETDGTRAGNDDDDDDDDKDGALFSGIDGCVGRGDDDSSLSPCVTMTHDKTAFNCSSLIAPTPSRS